MSKPIARVGIVGAGVMGSGIAAHLANAGIPVELLDIVPPNLKDTEKADPAARNRFAQGGLEKAIKAKPAAFFHASRARLVRTGNTEDHLDRLSGCDLVIEAIIEQIGPKRALFEKLDALLPESTVVASNTSGLRIAAMVEGRSEAFRKRFLVMHFFNPVRYMKLLELVPGTDTDPAVLARVSRLGQDVLGKGIVVGKDTPNFVGNRIGVHAMLTTIHQMIADGLAPEDIDAISGAPMGHPKSASFRTADMVGLDTFVHVAKNCFDSLPDDEDRKVFELPSFIAAMVEKKLLGDKTKSGFYKKTDAGLETFDPGTLAYRAKGGDAAIASAMKAISKVEDPRERVKKLVADKGRGGAFAWKVLAKTLSYSARRVGEIADDIAAIDDAMKWGYNWELGPFETWDALGMVETTERMKAEGVALPAWIGAMRDAGATSFHRADGAVWDPNKGGYVARTKDPRAVTLLGLRKGEAAVLKNDGAEAWDLGDGVLGVTFKTKANSLDPDVFSLMGDAIARAESDFEALLVYNQGEYFSVGANLFLVVMASQGKSWDQIRGMVKTYQDLTQRMKYARVPVVAAPYNMTLGGGLELCFGCAGVQAAAETYAGLVEVGVGLIPGGAGTLNMLWRSLEGIPEGTNANVFEHVAQTFKNIAQAKVATSADEAKQAGFFRATDGVSFDRARQLADAKARALGLARSGYTPPVPRAYVLPGESGIATLHMLVDTLVAGGYATPHDGVIAKKLAVVLCGGVGGATHEVTEDEILELERETFVSLCGEPKSQERMQSMLMTQKPLRN